MYAEGLQPQNEKNWTKKLFQLPSLKLTEAPENAPSQKETSIPTIHVQVLC